VEKGCGGHLVIMTWQKWQVVDALWVNREGSVVDIGQKLMKFTLKVNINMNTLLGDATNS